MTDRCDCTLGACVMLGNAELDIQRCDTCKRFASDDDAAHMVSTLLEIAKRFEASRPDATVADTLDAIELALTAPYNERLLRLVNEFLKACASPVEQDNVADDLERYAKSARSGAALWRRVGTERFRGPSKVSK